MKIIKCEGHEILVDDHYYEWAKWLAWHISEHGYAYRNINPKGRAYMAREIFAKTQILPTDGYIDHKNRNRLDNQESNLRWCTANENCYNRKKRSDSNAKYIGVHFHIRSKVWQAQFTYNGSRQSRNFYNEIEAARWRDKLAKQYHGQYAVLNFPE
jgi:HNH endonuclease